MELEPHHYGPRSQVNYWTPERIRDEIILTRRQIEESARINGHPNGVLQSKLLGLRVCAGEIQVKLKPVSEIKHAFRDVG